MLTKPSSNVHFNKQNNTDPTKHKCKPNQAGLSTLISKTILIQTKQSHFLLYLLRSIIVKNESIPLHLPFILAPEGCPHLSTLGHSFHIARFFFFPIYLLVLMAAYSTYIWLISLYFFSPWNRGQHALYVENMSLRSKIE